MSHGILLALPEDDPRFSVYALFSERLESKGAPLLLLSGSQIGVDGPFVRVRLDSPKSHQGLEFWIPLQFVVLMYSDVLDRRVGFVPIA